MREEASLEPSTGEVGTRAPQSWCTHPGPWQAASGETPSLGVGFGSGEKRLPRDIARGRSCRLPHMTFHCLGKSSSSRALADRCLVSILRLRRPVPGKEPIYRGTNTDASSGGCRSPFPGGRSSPCLPAGPLLSFSDFHMPRFSFVLTSVFQEEKILLSVLLSDHPELNSNLPR